LVDRIIEAEDLKRIVGLKNITASDTFLQGHFTNKPTYPETLLVEALMQTGAALFLKDPEYSGRLSFIEAIENMTFTRPVVPGDQVRLEIDVLTVDAVSIQLSAKALVEGRIVVEGRIRFNLAEKPRAPQIHPTASVHASAILGKDVSIGPYSIIGENVVIGDNTRIESHVMIEKWTKIGQNCNIFFGCVIGSEAQDVKYHGEKTWVVIGDRNEIREYVTINRSTGNDTLTEIGSDNIFLTNVHIAHNCKIGNNVIIANMTNLGGHTVVEDQATIGGMTGIHQFTRIGKGSMVGAYTRLPQDVPPYTLCEGNPAVVHGLNLVGMRRRGVPRPAIQEIKDIYKAFFRSAKNTTQALEDVKALNVQTAEAQYLLNFMTASSHRGILKKSEGELPADS